MEIDFLNDKYDLQIPEGDYQTLSGYIILSEQNIPTEGDEIAIGEYLFLLESVSDTRIEKVRVRRIHSTDEEQGTNNG